jgi:hypothetical protein
LTRPSGRVHAVVRLGSGRPSCTTVPRWIERLKLFKTVVAGTPFGPLFGRFFRRHATRARLSELTEASVAASVRVSVLVQSWLPIHSHSYRSPSMLSASVHCCSWVQLSVWHLAAAVAVALALVSWALRPRRKRHAACVALLGASHSVRCRERSRGSRSHFFQQIDTQCRANLQNAVSKTKQSKLQPLSGAGRFMSQRQPETHANLRAAKLSGDVATIARIAVSCIRSMRCIRSMCCASAKPPELFHKRAGSQGES